jgi:hypothetical protein
VCRASPGLFLDPAQACAKAHACNTAAASQSVPVWHSHLYALQQACTHHCHGFATVCQFQGTAMLSPPCKTSPRPPLSHSPTRPFPSFPHAGCLMSSTSSHCMCHSYPQPSTVLYLSCPSLVFAVLSFPGLSCPVWPRLPEEQHIQSLRVLQLSPIMFYRPSQPQGLPYIQASLKPGAHQRTQQARGERLRGFGCIYFRGSSMGVVWLKAASCQGFCHGAQQPTVAPQRACSCSSCLTTCVCCG